MYVRTARLVIIIILLILLVLMVLGRIYTYNNLHYDDRRLRKTRRAKYREKLVKAPGGAEICFAEGPDNGPPLLLIHDVGSCWEDYDAVLPALARQYHVFAVDCFGHGGSSRQHRLYSCTETGNALLWFIHSVITQPCYLAGHGTGGIIAAYMAERAPQLVRGLLLEDAPFFRITPEELSAGEGTLFWADSCELVHDFLHQSEQKDFALYYGENSTFLGLYGATRDRVVSWMEEERAQNGAGPVRLSHVPYAHLSALYFLDRYDLNYGEALYTGYWSRDLDLEKRLRGIQCSVICLKARDRYDRGGMLYSACSEQDLSQAQICLENMNVIVLRCGHSIHNEKPKQFLSAVEQLGKS